MSGGDSLEHECQTIVEDIFAHMQFRFSCICPTYKHNTVHNALQYQEMIKLVININQVNGRGNITRLLCNLNSNLNSENLIAAAKIFDFK